MSTRKKFTSTPRRTQKRSMTTQQAARTLVVRPRKSMLFQTDLGTGPERKNIDANPTITAGAGVWSAGSLLNGLAQGVGNQERVGRKTIMKSIHYRVSHQSATIGDGRLLVVYDKQSNGAAPAITDVVTLDLPNSALQLSNSDRFVVLFDDYLPIGNNSTGGSLYSGYKKINMETIYVGTTSAIASINSGSVYAFYINVTASIALTTYFRIRYVDN